MVVHFLKIIEWLNVNNNHNKKLKSLEGKRRVLAVDALLLSSSHVKLPIISPLLPGSFTKLS